MIKRSEIPMPPMNMTGKPDISHIYPVGDWREHEFDGDKCWCHPRIEIGFSVDMIVHNSMDRRELYEKFSDLH